MSRRSRSPRRRGGSSRERKSERSSRRSPVRDSRSSKRETSPRGRRSRRDDSRTPSRTPSYSPIFKERRSLWDQMIATETIIQPTSNPQNPQQLSQRRLYVGNLPDDVPEEQLLDFFNNAMIKANVVKSPGLPVVSVTIYRDKAYAFIELRTSEEANIGMSFDGITLHSKTLRVRRPKDYQPPSVQDVLDSTSMVNSNSFVSTNVADSPHKIFIGGLPPHLTDADVKKLLSMFGQLKSFNLVRDALTGLSKGFGFCEYSDSEVTDDACKALNGMTIGDKTLIVQRASINPKHNQPGGGTSNSNNFIVNQAAANMLNLSMPAAQLLASAVKNPISEPTNILVLMNIVNTVDFPGDKVEQEFDEIFDEIIEECSRFGNIKSVLIPKNPKREIPIEAPKEDIEYEAEKFPFNDDDDKMEIEKKFDDFIKEEGDEDDDKKEEKVPEPIINVPGYGRVFVEFLDVEDARTAQRALSGRRYDGRMVITSFLTLDKWKKRDLEPESMKIFDVYNFIQGTMTS